MRAPRNKKIGRFHLRSELGRGAFGTVYRAFDPTLTRDVALKIPSRYAQRGDLGRRFLREAQAAAKLRHPHLVSVYDAGVADDTLFIASEYVAGQSLVDECKMHWPSTRQAVEWVLQLAQALTYAHQEGIVHRDIKPSNILIDQQGHARLTDFGLAKHMSELEPEWVRDAARERGASDKLSRDGVVLGTPAYMAPEQASGKTSLTGPLSDQYSLGVVLYELLAGRVPFTGTLSQLLSDVRNPAVKAPSPRRFNRRIPADLAAVALRATQKTPRKRYGSMTEFASDLQRWLHGLPVSVRRRPWYSIVGRKIFNSWKVHPAFWSMMLTLALCTTLALITKGWLWNWLH
ncbi:MAG TPA: serine/threonine-protein kinase [Gemmatales bacterium]|nr:serine/threonine-protein kinase [Gemmatales bacterium]